MLFNANIEKHQKSFSPILSCLNYIAKVYFNFISKVAGLLFFLLVMTGMHLVSAQTPAGFSNTLISQFEQAVGLTFNRSGSQMFVWERAGRVWVVEGNVKKLLINISEEVGAYSDLGLLGFALHPQFETNGYFYLLYNVDRHHLLYYGTSSYSNTANAYGGATIGRLTRYQATKATSTSDFTIVPGSRIVFIGATISIGVPQLSGAHGIGSLCFATDGSLLVSTGDGDSPDEVSIGSASNTYYQQALTDAIIPQQQNVGAFRSQQLESYNGKILRIDPMTGNGYSNNPFYNSTPGSVRSKVWALGLRNPFRMSLKPGTGDVDPAMGQPGTILLGDVGWNTWEELDIVTKAAQNFGWPCYEGLTPHTGYQNARTYNQYAPNPLYQTNNCPQQYFYFQDLIKQETASGSVSFVNPCDGASPIPNTVKTFMHARPIIDWMHDTGPSRTGTFNGEIATEINIGAPGSPVSGPQFGGSSSTGGMVYPHADFPAQYLNTYFFADYGSGWIKSISIDGTNKQVQDFSNSAGPIVALATHPTEGGIYYITFSSSISGGDYINLSSGLRKLSYTPNQTPPVAVATSNKQYGPSPLTLQFTGSGSSDPNNQLLTYLWNFGDGASSTIADPSHTFTTQNGASAGYTVTLTVTNSSGLTDRKTLIISVNNTPPVIASISPADGTLYAITGQTTFPLRAVVTDNEQSSSSLTYRWETFLEHDTHNHPNPVEYTMESTLTTTGLGCGKEVYSYRIKLTVTDAGGLSTTREVKLWPYCGKVVSFTLVNADTDKDIPIPQLVEGAVLNLKVLPTKNLNIRTNTDPATVGSVVFNLSGKLIRNTSDDIPPYAAFGDVNGNYDPWVPAVGRYTLKGTAFSASGGGGTKGTSLTINFSVENSKPKTTNRAASIEGNSSSTANISTSNTIESDLRRDDLDEKDFLVHYYPNPFKRQFTLLVRTNSKDKVAIKIFDMLGRMVINTKEAQPQQSILLGKDHAPGTYILEVSTTNRMKRYKLVKTN